ncbi:MAG: hypothetical protein ACRYF5_06410 [Janthinobacterium lividum]
MTDRHEITEAMIAAASHILRTAGPLASQINHADVRRVLSAALGKMSTTDHGATFPLWVRTGIGTSRARFLSTTDRRCYYRVETEDGRLLIVHSNDIEPSKGAAASMNRL